MRKKGILPLPSLETLDRYINKIDRSFGFHDAVFDSLEVRAGRMNPQDKHGKYKETFIACRDLNAHLSHSC